MAVRIRLKRIGKIHHPIYRVVVVDSRKKRDGRVIEEVGKYDPNQEPSLIVLEGERIQYWLSVGAQPSDAVHRLLVLSGDWAKFKGAKNTESRIRYKDEDAAAAAAAIKAVEDAAEKAKAKRAEEAAKAAKEKEAAEKAAGADTEAEAGKASGEGEKPAEAAAEEAPAAEAKTEEEA